MPNIYSIYAHPHSSSTTSAINNLIRETAKKKGYTTSSNNLYTSKFNPVLSSSDMVSFRKGKLPIDIADEQNRITESDLLVLVYPIWWAGMPAILKGWIDRVFSYGFAYKVYDGKPIGLLLDKKAIIINTHGQPAEDYRTSGMFNAMNIVSDIGIFDFCGIEVMEHLYYEESNNDTNSRAKILDDIEVDLLQSIPESEYFSK